ncbi:hypothetical protein CPLU01_00575 [Colletotrichum plurivorum]|uniref:Uncharacterized protein n=1 Tax=Colletotrichum plurivorum TaxID=2175906 RepID=A0A8H6NRW6_9PEZI|nr:hypothetical protein CPLU01_00575 [Colletotrichum plurivorum]
MQTLLCPAEIFPANPWALNPSLIDETHISINVLLSTEDNRRAKGWVATPHVAEQELNDWGVVDFDEDQAEVFINFS